MKHFNWTKKALCLIPISTLGVFTVGCSFEIKPGPKPVTTITITFDASGEGEEITQGSATQDVDKGILFGRINCPKIEKTSSSGNKLVFSGWSHEREGDPISPSETINSAITVYPLWTEESETTQIIAKDDNGKLYVCNIDTLCTDNKETQIELTPKEGGPSITRRRDVFNWEISVGKDILYLPDYFLYSCSNFDKTITFANDSSLIYIGQSFMSCCSKYNELLELPNSLRCIQDNFLGQCMVFNNGGDEDFVIPDSVQIIGQDFFSGCEDFNQNIEFTEYLNFLGYNCMFNCRSFTKNLEVNTAPSNINIGTGWGWASDEGTDPIHADGFTISGSSIEWFKENFKTTDGPYFWRKLKN